MKTIKIHLKVISLFVIALILLQSCTVYKSTTATLDEAFKSNTKTKVITTDNQTLKFMRIDFIDGKYYGVSKTSQKFEDMPLDINNISSIKVKNKTVSAILNVGTPVVLVGLTLYGASTMPTGGFY